MVAKKAAYWDSDVMEKFILEYKSQRRMGVSKSQSRVKAQWATVPSELQYAETTIYRTTGLNPDLLAKLAIADKELSAESFILVSTPPAKAKEVELPLPPVTAKPEFVLSQTEMAMIQLMRGMQAEFASIVETLVDKKFAAYLDFTTTPAPIATPAKVEMASPAPQESKAQAPEKLPPVDKDLLRPVRPKVLIVGCLDSQFEMVKQRNRACGIEFSHYSSQRSASHRLGELAAAADIVIVLKDFISHSAFDVVRSRAKQWILCVGMHSAIDKILIENNFFK